MEAIATAMRRAAMVASGPFAPTEDLRMVLPENRRQSVPLVPIRVTVDL